MTVTTKPKLSVIMPVYNAGKYLKEAIDSILCQSFKDYEFIIIDDGSTDDSSSIIGSYIDSRIKFIQNKRNMNLIASLNIGIDIAHGEYIARMDADDVSHQERLRCQVKVLDNFAEVGC